MSDGRPLLLALRALKLGDLLVAVPAVKALRRAHPGHRIVLASPGWLDPIARLIDVEVDGRSVPAVDAVLPTSGLDHALAVPRGAVDIAVNLHGHGPESRGLLERLQPRERVGHAAPGWRGPLWQDGMLERERWARLVTRHGMPADADEVHLRHPDASSPAPGAAVVHVGAFYGSRAWPVERFAQVARSLAADGPVIVTAGERAAEAQRAEDTARLAGLPSSAVFAGASCLPLDGFAASIAEARLVVSVDTGAAHLASAYRTPSVIIFGPAPVAEWGPPPGPHRVLTDARRRRGDVFSEDPDPALLAVTAADVLSVAQELDSLDPSRAYAARS